MGQPRRTRVCGILAAGPGRRRGLTLVELALALGILTVAVGALIQLLWSANTGHERLRNRQWAFQKARNIAEDVLRADSGWEALCTAYDAEDGVDVVVEDGDGDPLSEWHKVSVWVVYPPAGEGVAEEAVLVFGK